MLKLLLFIFLLLISTTLFSQTDDPYRLSHKVEPVYQLIHFNLDPDKDTYSGRTSIEMKIKEKLTSFRLHGKEFEITEVELKLDEKSYPVEYESQEYGLLKIISKEELAAGNYTLSFRFKGQYDKMGQGIIKYTKDRLNYLYTHFEPIHARRFFPCFDEPKFKFTYQLEITAPKDYLVFSNTPEEKETVEDISKTTLFKKTKPTPSYLLAFAVGPYETTPIPGLSIPGRIILSKGYLDKSLYIKNHTAKILKSLEDYFGSPYPYEKLDFIGTGIMGGAMENPGLVVFGESFLIDSEFLSLNDKRSLIRVTAHELAHMWFGNLVSLIWWDDNWLKEGFAEWLANEIVLQAFPELDNMEFVAGNMNRPLNDDTKATTEPIHRHMSGKDNPYEVFDFLTYYKGQTVLRMAENWIGRNIFRTAMKTYFEKYKWKNTSAEDLFEILEEVSGKDITQVMHDFVFQAGVPVIEILQKNSNTISLSQQRYKSIENSNNYTTTWHIPITLKLYDGNVVHEKYLYLDQKSKDFSFPEIDKIEWIHLKNNLLGYYLQNLPMDMFKQAIYSDELSIYEKNDLFTGLEYSYLAGKTNPTDILELAYTVRNTSDEAILEPTAIRVDDIFSTFRKNLDENNSNIYLNHTLLPFLKKVGYEYTLEDSRIRRNTRRALFDMLKFNDDVRNRVVEIARQHLLSDTQISFDDISYLKFLYYYDGSLPTYEKVRQRLEETNDPSERNVLFWSLGWFENDTLVQKNLDLSLSENIGPNERMPILHSIQWMYHFDKHSKNNIFPWFHEHYAFFKDKVSREYLDSWHLPMFINNQDDLDLFNQLFPEEERSKTLNKNIAAKAEGIKRQKELRKLYADDLNKYLEDFR